MKRRILSRAVVAVLALSVCGCPLMAESFQATYEAADWLSSDVDAPTQGDSVSQQTDALQAMMRLAGEAARNGRVKVHFGAGRYVIDDYLPICSNMSIELDDDATVVSVSEAAPGMLTAHHFDEDGGLCPRDASCRHDGYSQITNVTICGGTWDRNANPLCDTYIVRLVHGADIVISNVTFKAASDHFLNLSGTSNVVLRSVNFSDAVRYQGEDPGFWGKFAWGAETRYTTIEAVHLDYCSLEGEPNAYPLDETACQDVLIDGCSFSGVFAGVGTHHNPLGDRARGVTILNSRFESCLSYACYAFGFSNLEIRNCDVRGGEGLVYASRSDLCAEENVVDSASASAVYVYDASDGLFRNNAFSNSCATVFRANGESRLVALTNVIHVAGRHGVSATGGRVVLSGNAISRTTENGVYVDGATAEVCDNEIAEPGMAGVRADNGAAVVACGNRISDAGTHGVSIGVNASFAISDNAILRGGANGVRVEKGADGGSVSGNEIASSGERGIYLLDVRDVRVEDNAIRDSALHGLFVQGGSVAAVGNAIDTTGKDANGVFLKQTTAMIATNTIANAGASGIRADDGTTLVASGNIITNPQAHGLSIGGLSSYRLDGNAVTDARKTGIFVSACQGGGSVSGNRIARSGESGISLVQSEGAVVSGNQVEVTGGFSEGIYVREAATATIRDNTALMTGGHAIRVQGAAGKPMTAVLSGNTAQTANPSYADIRVGDYCLNCVLTENVTSDGGIKVSKNETSGTRIIEPVCVYSVTFDGNGATGGKMAALSINVGETTALTANAFTRTGWTFLGWATRKDATAADYANQAKVKDLAKTDGAKVTLYAVWKVNAYTVKFDGNGATSGAMAAQARTYGDGKALTANAFKRTNCHFLGWSTTKGGAVKYTNKQADNLSAKAGATVTLYAVWKISAYKVAFDGNGATSGAVEAQAINVGAATALTANAFARTGCTFLGWSTKKDATAADYKDAAKVKNLTKTNGATVTLYAVWKANAYTVKFDGNGATSGKMAAQARTYGDGKKLPANAFKRTNFHFLGWATAKGGAVKYADKKAANLSKKDGATVILYAVWEISTYKVAFDGNGATSGTMKAQAVNVGAAKALRANAFARTGCTFQGWAKKKDATKADYKDKAKVTNLTKTNGATVTLYAVWKANAFTVKFDGNGATSGTMKNLAMTYGKAKALTANAFRRTNWTFLGWAKKKDATAADYADQAKVKNLAKKAGAAVTLYAVWRRGSFTVKFDGNGATSGAVKAQKMDTAAKTALTANAFKRAGYEFLGWSTKKDATTATYANKAKVKDLAKAGKSVTLYAVWSLPAWAHGTFNGWGSYWSPSRNAWFDGIPKVTVSSLGKLSGTFTLEAPGGGADTVKFSASAFSKYYSSRSMDQVLDLLDPGEDDDPYGIVEDAENGFVPAKIAVYVYKGVSFTMPDGTARKADIVLLSRLYDGKSLCGFCCLSLASGMDMGLHQNLFASKHVTLPQFDGTPKKSFAVSTAVQDGSWQAVSGKLTKVEVTFGANGKLTAVGYKGTSKKWTTSATLRVCGYDGSVFGAATDFMTPDGTQLWFDCDLEPGANGKVSASGITFEW